MTPRRRHVRRHRLGVALAAAMLALGGCEPPAAMLPNHQLLRDVYSRGPATAPVVALTFDDGPNGRCTAEVLDALADTRAPATFFVLGANLEHPENAALLARMLRDGHSVGLHGWAHSTNPQLRDSWSRHELARSRDAVVAAAVAAGLPPPAIRFYRPPYGFLTGTMARAAEDADLAIVEWTVSVEDWRRGWTADALSGVIAGETRAGDVIVLHDGEETSHRSAERCDRRVEADAVRRLVPALRARGLDVAPLATVLGLPPSSR